MKKQLRFAGLVRVSTEGQKEKGASIDTQKNSIKNSVEYLGGNPSSIKWYDGQEHSTEGYERKICDQLLHDSGENLFDAVICYDLSRWSRDNLRSKTNLKVLEKNGIEFYEGTKKYDLSDFNDIFYIGIMTEINERAAKEIKTKMCEGKITRAQEGWAVSSPKCLPWGREFDNDKSKKKEYANVFDRWSLKAGAKERMNTIVDRYINGEKTETLANEMGIYPSNLLEIFRSCLGNKWNRVFSSPRRNKKVPVEIPIPALIDDEKKIEKVMETIESKRTWAHGSYKIDYLFSSMIFDEDCGHTLTGTSKKGKKYYYHQDNRKKGCGSRRYLPEKDLEIAVLTHLFYMYEDDDKIEKAVLRAYPEQDKFEKLLAEEANDTKEIKRIEKAEDTLAKAISEGVLGFDVAKRRADKLKKQKESIESKIEERKPLLENRPPTKKEIEEEVEFIKMEMDLFRTTMSHSLQSPSRLSIMSFADKRRLMELAFGGKDIKGNRLGIYVSQGSTKKSVRIVIKGKFSNNSNYKEQINETLPIKRWRIQEVLGINPYEEDVTPFDETEIKRMKLKKKKREQKRKKLLNSSKKVKSGCFNIVLPEPGGPIISTLWFPAAAMVSARFTCS